MNATLQSPPSVNGNGTLVTISFHVEALGESELDLSDTKLRDQAAMHAWMPIPHGVSDGYFSNFTPLPGDANNDGIVDIEDVLFLAIHFGSAKEDEPKQPWNDTRNWDPVADLNGDDRINIFDFVIIGINFGRER